MHHGDTHGRTRSPIMPGSVKLPTEGARVKPNAARQHSLKEALGEMWRGQEALSSEVRREPLRAVTYGSATQVLVDGFVHLF
jgi:hypothetical protein